MTRSLLDAAKALLNIECTGPDCAEPEHAAMRAAIAEAEREPKVMRIPLSRLIKWWPGYRRSDSDPDKSGPEWEFYAERPLPAKSNAEDLADRAIDWADFVDGKRADWGRGGPDGLGVPISEMLREAAAELRRRK